MRYSYEPLLMEAITTINPINILEWGPGRSTLLMANNTSADIYTFEHNKKWDDKWLEVFADYPNIFLSYVPLDMEYSTIQAKLFPKHFFDLVFIDGRNRAECLATAYDLVKGGGVVILHDCNRKRYWDAMNYYRIVKIFRNTAMLKL